MKYVSSSVLFLLMACQPSTTTVGSNSMTLTSSPNTASLNAAATASNPVSPTQYMYALIGNLIATIPIDPSSGDLIETQSNSWTTAPNVGSNDVFISLLMDSAGKSLYALASNYQNNNGIYQYTITQNVAYSTSATNPLVAMSPAKVIGPTNIGYFSLGPDGNVYLQNNNYTPYRVNQYVPNVNSHALSFVQTVFPASLTSLNLSWAVIPSASNGNDSYTIDSGANRILHYRDGVLQQSFQVIASGELTSLALH